MRNNVQRKKEKKRCKNDQLRIKEEQKECANRRKEESVN